MRRELRVGIVGCGGIARAHVRAYQKVGCIRIVAVYDVLSGAAQRLAKETGARVAASPAEMARQDTLDAVSICSPPAAHYENCRPFLAAGVPVLCEKPLEVNLPRACRLAAAVRRSGTPFMVAFCHRFHPAIIELRKLIVRGVLGRPILFRNIFGGYLALKGNHRADPHLSGGGCLIDHCSHSVDLFRFLVGEPACVQAITGNVLQNVPIEDFGMMHLETARGGFGEITSSYSFKVCRNWVEWYGTKGTALVSYWNEGEPDLRYRVAGGAWKVVDCSRHPDRFTAEIAHFLSCVRNRRRPAITVADGLAANRIVAAAYESVARGRRIDIG